MRLSHVLTAAALGLAIATMLFAALTTSDGDVVVRPLLGLAFVLFAGLLVLGSSRWIGVASIPMVGVIAVETGFGENPSWIRSLLLGCLWYLTLEVAWEAIERRDGAQYSPAANARRAQELAMVVGLSLTVGFVAATATSALAPVRSVALQALVLGALFAAFVSMIRQSGQTEPGR